MATRPRRASWKRLQFACSAHNAAAKMAILTHVLLTINLACIVSICNTSNGVIATPPGIE